MLGGEIVYYNENKKKKKGFRIQADGGRVRQAVEASPENSFVATYARRTYGLRGDYYMSKSLIIYTSLLDTRDIKNSLIDAGSTVPLQNQAMAVGFKSTKKYRFIDSLNAEAGYSVGEIAETGTAAQTVKDAAWLVNTSKNVKPLSTNFTFDYTEYRPEFLFLFGSAGSDNRTLALNGSSTFFRQKLNWNNGYSFSHDNLERQKSATTYNHTINTAPTLSLANWPVFALTETLVLQNTTGDAQLESDTVNNTISLNIGYGFKAWQRSHQSSLTLSQNDTVTRAVAQNTQNRNRTIATQYGINQVLSWLSFSLAYSINIGETSENPIITFADTSTLNLTPSITAIKLSFPLVFSYARTFDNGSPAQTDNETLSTNLSVNHSFSQKYNLSLAAGYSIYKDKINNSSNYKQVTATVTFNSQF